jgi:hypothetical protein
MTLKKALEIVNYYAFTVLKLVKPDDDLTEEEVDELNEAREKVKEFIKEFN